MIQFPARSKVAKIVLIGFAGGISLFTLAASIYIPFHYAAVMPRSPQPETGRIYPIKAQYEVLVYVNQQELERRNFVKYDLTSLTAISGLLLFWGGLVGVGSESARVELGGSRLLRRFAPRRTANRTVRCRKIPLISPMDPISLSTFTIAP